MIGRHSSSILRLQTREPHMRKVPKANHRLDRHILRALNKIKKPSTAEEITELLNRDLGSGDQPFQLETTAISTCRHSSTPHEIGTFTESYYRARSGAPERSSTSGSIP
jgi:hypothetical protein